MKYFYSTAFLCALIFLSFTASATVWTVSNNPDRPAQFTAVQTAVDAASPSDTILVTGGTYNETVTLVKNLVLYGEAIEGPEFPHVYITAINFGRFNSSLSSSGSRVYGTRIFSITINPSFSGALAGQQTLDDIIIERCWIQGGNMYNYANDGVSNITFRNSLISGANLYLDQSFNSNFSALLMTNCIFDNTRIDGYTGSNVSDMNGNLVIRNSVFLNRSNSCFGEMAEVVLENNIFYAAEPTGLSLSTFNNNLTYLCNSNMIPYGDNLGSANIVNQDPLFTNYPALGGNHSWDWDYSLQAGSPALGTGTNGTDIGLGGGNAPVDNLPKYAKIPGVTLLDIPVSSVPVGGTLQINIEAESRD